MKILVFGAAGSQQYHVIGEAKEKGAEVLAATSSEKNMAMLKNAGATPHVANMAESERMREITKGIDAIAFLVPVSLPNPPDGLQYAKNVIDAAKENGVQKIVWNTSGWLLPHKMGIPSEDVKLDIRDYLKNSGLDFVIIEPTIYMENLMGPFCAPFIKNEKKLAYPTPEAMPIGWIASRDVSALVVAAIFFPKLKADTFRVSGLENLKGNDLAKKFSLGLGEKITYYTQPAKEFGKMLEPFVGEGAAASVASYYEGLQNATEHPQKYNPDMDQVLEQLPVKMTLMEDWVRSNRMAFVD